MLGSFIRLYPNQGISRPYCLGILLPTHDSWNWYLIASPAPCTVGWHSDTIKRDWNTESKWRVDVNCNRYSHDKDIQGVCRHAAWWAGHYCDKVVLAPTPPPPPIPNSNIYLHIIFINQHKYCEQLKHWKRKTGVVVEFNLFCAFKTPCTF